jgi:hypothetical protein
MPDDEVVFSEDTSLIFKETKIHRFFDASATCWSIWRSAARSSKAHRPMPFPPCRSSPGAASEPWTALAEVTPYITKDGSEIRELLHPDQHAVRHQSLAEAVIPAGHGNAAAPPSGQRRDLSRHARLRPDDAGRRVNSPLPPATAS